MSQYSERPCWPEGGPALVMHRVRKAFGHGLNRGGRRSLAVSDVTLEVNFGELVCLAGREGSGKSALLQCAAGLVKRDAGEIRWFGEFFEGGGLIPAVGFIPAVPVYYPFLTPRDVLAIRASKENQRPQRSARACADALSLVQLSQRAGRPVAELCRDEIRRLAIAEALISQPLALLVDTAPTEGSTMSPVVIAAVRHFVDCGGAAIVAVRDATHVAEAASRLAIIVDGRLSRSFSGDAALAEQGILPANSPLQVAETFH